MISLPVRLRRGVARLEKTSLSRATHTFHGILLRSDKHQ
jgi:hypothetical protein